MKPIKVIKAIVLLSFPMCVGATTLIAVQDTVPEKYVKVEEESTKNNNSSDIDFIVGQQPEFVGGQTALLKYLAANVVYPQEAREKSIQGKSILQFVINEDGSISDITVLRKVGGGCDEEAIRIVKAMPKWNPGLVLGRPVKVKYVLPVSFRLE